MIGLRVGTAGVGRSGPSAGQDGNERDIAVGVALDDPIPGDTVADVTHAPGTTHAPGPADAAGAAGGPAIRRWVMLGVAGASLVFAALATLTALAVPPFTSADEAQHTSYALDVGGGTLPVVDTPVRSVLPGMPGLPADCVVTPEQARAGLDAARARLARENGSATRFPGRPTAVATHPTGSAGATRPPSMAVEMASAAGMPACARGPRGIRDNTQLTYTANHPPLFYVIESVPLEAGLHTGHPVAGFRAARLLNVVIGMTALVAVAWLVRELVPSRPDLAVGTAAVLGTIGMFVNSSGQLYNDGLSVATIIAGLAATVALLRRGPSASRLVCLAILALAAAATRASGLLAAGLLLPAAGVAVALHARGSLHARGRWRRLGFAAATVAGGVATLGAGIGWFYWRNIQLYGDPTASGLIAKMFPVSEEPMKVEEILRSRAFGWAVYRGFFGRPRLLADGRDLTDAVRLVLLVLVLGLTLAVLRRAARWCVTRWPLEWPLQWPPRWPRAARPAAIRRVQSADHACARPEASDDAPPGRAEVWRRRLPGAVAWLLVALHVAVVVATLIGYVAAGGAWFARYLLPAVPIAALFLAVALAALPGARRGLPTVVAVAALATMAGVMTARELAFKLPALRPHGTVGRLHAALVVSGIDAPTFTIWMLGLVAVVGLLLLAAAMWTLSANAVPAWPLPRPLRHRLRGASDRLPGRWRPADQPGLISDG